MSIELKVNASLLKKVEDQLRSPKDFSLQFDMRMWLGTEEMHFLDPNPDTVESLEASGYCGTVACLAGHVIILGRAFKEVENNSGWVRGSLHQIFPEIAGWTKLSEPSVRHKTYSHLYSNWAQLTQTSSWWGVVGLSSITEEMAADVIRYIRLERDIPGTYGVVKAFFNSNYRKAYRRRGSK